MKISRIISSSAAFAAATIIFANTASASNMTSIAQGSSENDKLTHWFGSGYARYYDSVDYNINTMVDGTITVSATANRSYTPEELEGDYIKFGMIKYSDTSTVLQFDTASFTNGSFFTVDKTPDGAPSDLHYIEIWCKHAAWGLKEGSVFELTLAPINDRVCAKVELFDKSYQMVNRSGGGYAGINHYTSYTFDEWYESTHAIEVTPIVTTPPAPSVPDEFEKVDLGGVNDPPETTAPSYDVNQDGKIDWDDVMVLVQYIVENGGN